jgi:DNA-binding beta-propeller fold protein YncE
MSMRFFRILIAVSATLTCSAVAAAKQLKVCESNGREEYICGIPAPEDIEPLPDGRHLLLSSFGGLKGESKSPLNVLDTTSLTVEPIAIRMQEKTIARWDDNLCPGPPAPIFSSHGIHLSKRKSGTWQLLAVNHDRESVEMFEFRDADGTPTLIWHGCVVMPADSYLNDVVALAEGGFLASHMITLGDNPSSEIVNVNNRNGPSGFILRWRPGFGVDKLAGGSGNLTNGLAVSSDGRAVYVVETGSHDVRRITYDSGETTGQVNAFGDNLSWAMDGRLIVTGVTSVPESCVTRVGSCRPPFEVRAIDTRTMSSELVFLSEGSPGGGTVAVFQGRYMYVGSLMGDRLLRVRYTHDKNRLH